MTLAAHTLLVKSAPEEAPVSLRDFLDAMEARCLAIRRGGVDFDWGFWARSTLLGTTEFMAQCGLLDLSVGVAELGQHDLSAVTLLRTRTGTRFVESATGPVNALVATLEAAVKETAPASATPAKGRRDPKVRARLARVGE